VKLNERRRKVEEEEKEEELMSGIVCPKCKHNDARTFTTSVNGLITFVCPKCGNLWEEIKNES
jgi:transposase-like protein